MIRQLSDFVVSASESFPRFLLAAVLGPATLFLALFPMMQAFVALSGGPQPFDWQNDLTAETMAQQIAGYTEPMRRLYYAHAFVDYVFPIFVGTFFGAIAAFALRKGTPRLFDAAARTGMFALFFISVPFDYCENTGILAALLRYPQPPGVWADLALFGKSAKLVTEFLIPGATALALVVGTGGRLAGRLAGQRWGAR